MPGEDELAYAERAGELMERCRDMRARGASISEVIALFDREDEDDDAAAGVTPPRGMRGNPNEPGDLGDQIVARMVGGRGGRPFAGEPEPAANHGPKDLGDLIVERMTANRGVRRAEGTTEK